MDPNLFDKPRLSVDPEDVKYQRLPEMLLSLYHREIMDDVYERLLYDLRMVSLKTDELTTSEPEEFWRIFFDYLADKMFNHIQTFRALCIRIDLDHNRTIEICRANRPREGIKQVATLVLLRIIQIVRSK